MTEEVSVELLAQRLSVLLVPPEPAIEVNSGREHIPLETVAGRTGEDEIVPQIARVSGPRDEMVDVGPPHLPGAIETSAPLHFQQDRPILPERGPIRAEQELPEILGLPQEPTIRSQVSQEPDPGILRESNHESVEKTKAVGDARAKSHLPALFSILVEEILHGASEGLQLPQRHVAYGAGDFPHQRGAASEAHLRGFTNPAVFDTGLSNEIHDPGLLSGVLPEYSRSVPMRIRFDLTPVVAHEPGRDLLRVDPQGLTRIVPLLHRDVGEGEKEREFVGGREASLVEETLDVGKKVELELLARGAHCLSSLQ